MTTTFAGYVEGGQNEPVTIKVLWNRRGEVGTYRDGLTLQQGRWFLRLGSYEIAEKSHGTFSPEQQAVVAAIHARFAAAGQPHPQYGVFGGQFLELSSEELAPVLAAFHEQVSGQSSDQPSRPPALSDCIDEHVGRLMSGD